MWNYLYNFSYIYGVFKRFVCHNFTVEMYIFLLYSLTSAQWSKIAELILGYRCATSLRLYTLYNYKYNI